MSVILEARKVAKAFPGVQAVQDLTLTISSGEVHCLVGENGAGKSTVIKILSGEYLADAGAVLLEGRPVRFTSPLAARLAGISVIHQEVQLVPELSVAENIVLGRWPGANGFVDRRAVRRAAAELLPRVGLDIDPSTTLGLLSAGQQQLVEIARALSFSAKVLILDEPTSSLSASETRTLFGMVRQLRSEGLGILYVSHRMEEIFELGDTVSVMRDGRHVDTRPIQEVTRDDIVEMMVGGRTSLFVDREHHPGDVILEVDGLTRRGAFADISFNVRRGEVVGLGGLVGAGRTEVVRCVFGLEPADAGEIRFAGEKVKITGPWDAVQHGFALIPEDRKTQGLVLPLSVGANIEMSSLRRLATGGWLHRAAERRLVADFISELRIRTPSAGQPVSALSGGNQQKVVIGRWLATKPRLIFLDEPTRGVDVGAKAEIHRLVEGLVREGLGVVLISSELPELIAMSDRVYVMRRGSIVRELIGADINATEVMRYAAGAERGVSPSTGREQTLP